MPSAARLLTSQWLSARPSVCALVGCGEGDVAAVSVYLGQHIGDLCAVVQALARDIDKWEA